MREKLLLVLADIAPLAVYYGTEALTDTHTALIASVVWVFVEIAFLLATRRPLTLFFFYSSGITLLFGVTDLYFSGPLQPYDDVASNLLTGALVLSLLFAGAALVREALARQKKPLPPFHPAAILYVRGLVVVATLFFWAKAGVVYWIAGHAGVQPNAALSFLAGTTSVYLFVAAALLLARPAQRILIRLGVEQKKPDGFPSGFSS